MMSGCMALSVTAVSISVSPFRMEEEPTDRLISVRPRSDACFFSIWRLSATNSSARSRRPKISSRDIPSIPNRWRWPRTKVDFWAMFIKAVSIGPARAARKGSRGRSASRLWMFLDSGRGAGGSSGSPAAADRSLDLDTGVANDLAPLLDVRLDLCGEFLRRAADRREAERRQRLLHVGQPDDPRQLAGQNLHHRPRSRGRRHQADDQLGFLILEAAFRHGRNVGHDRRSPGA